MSINVIFNNTNILDAISSLGGKVETQDITRNIASNFANVYQDQGNNRYGQNFQYNQLSVKPIQVILRLVGDNGFFNDSRDKLALILNVREPKELIFEDEPNKIWLAIPTGQVTLAPDYSTSPATATLTVPFEVPSARGFYKNYDSVSTNLATEFGSITKISNNHFKASLINNGTAESYPIITIKHKSENGWIGLVNSDGKSYEIGNSEEVDKQPAKRSELLLDFRDEKIVDGLASASKNVAILNDTTQKLNGTIGTVDVWSRKHLYLANVGGTVGNNAGSLTWTIPADSNGVVGSLNDYIWWRQAMWLGKSQQYGFMKLTVSDENDQILYGVETFKRANGLDCEYNVMVADGKGSYKIIDRKKFLGTHIEAQNPFSYLGGWSDIRRIDDRLTAFWWGSYPERIVPELKGKVSKKIHLAWGAIGNNEIPTHMYVDSIYYSKQFVDYLEDIPNRYVKGSTVVLDMSKGLVTVDGKASNNDEIGEPEPLQLPIGQSEIDIYFSSWLSADPEITIEWREMFV